MLIGTQYLVVAPGEGEPPAHLAALADEARSYAQASRAPATLAAYAKDWAHYTRWAADHGLEPLGSGPEVLAFYVTELARTHRPSTIVRRLAAISVIHQHHGLVSPTTDAGVRDIVRGVRRTVGAAPREATPVTIGELRRVVARLPSTRAGRRDRVVLLVGFAGALRRSELVALDVEDLRPHDHGLLARVRRGKTDQEGMGRDVALPRGRDTETCPVTAINDWIADAGITSGALIRSVDRHGTVGGRLSDRSVALIVKAAAARIGLDPALFSGHSLRSGFATTAAANGASERKIATQTGHRSMEVLRRYIRTGTVFSDNAVTDLGL